MGVTKELRKKALGVSQKALERLFADERRATKIAEALGAVQRGKQSFDQASRAVMNQLNFATRADFKELGKRLSALKRRVRAIDERLGPPTR